MAYKINYNSTLETTKISNKHIFGGSAKFMISSDGELLSTPKKVKEPIYTTTEKTPKTYKLNKSKVKNKIAAFASIKKTHEVMKFITISFPNRFQDDHAQTALNTWLTRLRKLNKNFEYIWIKERQKNKTVHYHIITNSYFNIRVINHYMAKIIENLERKFDMFWINFTASKYNGVDIKAIYNNKQLAKYVTKYVTKSNQISDSLLWNCSSLISSLFTEHFLSKSEFEYVRNNLELVGSRVINTCSQIGNIKLRLYNTINGGEPPYLQRLKSLNNFIAKNQN